MITLGRGEFQHFGGQKTESNLGNLAGGSMTLVNCADFRCGSYSDGKNGVKSNHFFLHCPSPNTAMRKIFVLSLVLVLVACVRISRQPITSESATSAASVASSDAVIPDAYEAEVVQVVGGVGSRTVTKSAWNSPDADQASFDAEKLVNPE